MFSRAFSSWSGCEVDRHCRALDDRRPKGACMTSTGPKDDRPDLTTMVIGLALQALIERLIASGMLDSGDLAVMPSHAFQHAADLAAHRYPEFPSGTAAL